MKVIADLTQTSELIKPIALTIGTYDGVHLGHQYLIDELKKKGKSTCIVTFSNHPATFFRPDHPIALLTTTKHKLELFKNLGIDLTLLLPFDKALAETPYDIFLKTLHDHIPFSYLILGEGATLGKNKAGNAENITTLGQAIGFETTYLQKKVIDGTTVSSGIIRTLIKQGKLKQASDLLGRPYGFYLPDKNTLDTSEPLAFPPNGTYAGRYQGKSTSITINSPSIQISPPPTTDSPLIEFV